MRCPSCKSKNADSSRFCSQCGAILTRQQSFYKFFAIMCISLFSLMLIVLTLLLGVTVSDSLRKDADTSLPSQPMDTSAQASEAFPSASAPTETTPSAPDRAVTASISDDTTPVDALISFLLTGDVSQAEKAFHPMYIDSISGKLGFFTDTVSNELLIRAFHMRLSQYIKRNYGSYDSIGYIVKGRHKLGTSELEALNRRLNESGIPSADDARELELRLELGTEKDSSQFDIVLTVFLSDGNWYIDINALAPF